MMMPGRSSNSPRKRVWMSWRRCIWVESRLRKRELQ